MTVTHSGSNVRFTERQGAKSKSAMAQQSSRRTAGSTLSSASDECFVMLKVNDAPSLPAWRLPRVPICREWNLKRWVTPFGKTIRLWCHHADPVMSGVGRKWKVSKPSLLQTSSIPSKKVTSVRNLVVSLGPNESRAHCLKFRYFKIIIKNPRLEAQTSALPEQPRTRKPC